MKLRTLRAGLTALAWLALTCVASAQTGTSGATASNGRPIAPGITVKIDGERADNTGDVYINAGDCEDNVEVSFEIDPADVLTPDFLEVWRSNNATNDCRQVSSRTDNNMTPSPCDPIGEAIQNPSFPRTITFKTQELFGAGEDGACTAVGTQIIYFVPLMSKSEGPNASAQTPSNFDLYVKFSVLTSAPNVPTSISAIDGESQVGIEWKGSNDQEFDGYRVYFDTSGISERGAKCESEILVEGEPPPKSGAVSSKTTSTRGVKNPKDLGLSLNEQIPVAVTVIDEAGNESPLSEVVCASYIDTRGFIEEYEAQGGDGLEKCTAMPGRTRAMGLTFMLLTMIGAAFVVRRRLS